jgi:hypothetical protein
MTLLSGLEGPVPGDPWRAMSNRHEGMKKTEKLLLFQPIDMV